MANTRIRTLNFLPEIFQTPTNTEFLSATLDQLVNPPNVTKIQGYIGGKFGYGIDASDFYIPEPTKIRQDYQLEPGVVFLKDQTKTAKDFLTYPGILDSIKNSGGIEDDNSKLFNADFYSWDSFTDFDKIINFNQYYWLPNGPPAAVVGSGIVFTNNEFIVTDVSNAYSIREAGTPDGSLNPTLTLIRGGTYSFVVDQDSQFWIQAEPGTSGFSPSQPNLPVRDVLGVTNNGATQGIVTFTVPLQDEQDALKFPGNFLVDVVSNKLFDDINNKNLSEVKDIDGITSLNGLRVLFFDSGDTDPSVSANFFRVQYSGNSEDPVIQLIPDGTIPNNKKITASFGDQWRSRSFYKNDEGIIVSIPLLTAPLDRLFYQDGSSPLKVGEIKLIDSNDTNILDVNRDILGKEQFTSDNGVVFTNGLKVRFDRNTVPSKFQDEEYYVEGVGEAIQLIPESSLVSPEGFTQSEPIPWDSTPWDGDNFDANLFVPKLPDYITVSRKSLNKNAWTRSNRWFHIDVITATARYNNSPDIITRFANKDAKAKRPIIEFREDLKLFNSGTSGKDAVDFIDTRTADALSLVAGERNYYPDVDVSTEFTAVISSVTGEETTTIEISNDDITGSFEKEMFITDSTGLLPANTQISDIVVGLETTILTVVWEGEETFSGTSEASIIATRTTVDNFALFPGARVIFAADEDLEVKNKIFVADFSVVTPGDLPVITLSVAEDGVCEPGDQAPILRGFSNQGASYFFDGVDWKKAQQKTTVNQQPLYDIFDSNGISFGDPSVYNGTSFAGCTLFSFGVGTGTNDPVLGFPIRVSGINNIGDISFDVTLNSDVFSYTSGSTPVTQKINTGYVHAFKDRVNFDRELGWKRAIAPSEQYQLFDFEYKNNAAANFVCDVPARTTDNETKGWPPVKVYVDNILIPFDEFTVSTDEHTTLVSLKTAPQENATIQILILSDKSTRQGKFVVPINLNNNPFNDDLTIASIGDIRAHYQDIFSNFPKAKGNVFGINNLRDLGNTVNYGTKIIKNSSSLVLPSVFLRKQQHSLTDALLYNSREYIKFKQLIVDSVNRAQIEQTFSPSVVLETALDMITDAKSETQSFFWSDMVPSKAPKRSRTFVFDSDLDIAVYPLSKVYDFEKANYEGVLVYLNRTVNGQEVEKLLISGEDYVVSSTAPSLQVKNLLAGDKITIKEYSQTYGSFVPNTPTKLGLYPASVPSVVLDDGYLTPTYFIKGHDGSYTKLFGDYDPENDLLVDFRDQALLEFEKRIFNNLKLKNKYPTEVYDILPGYFRETENSWEEFLEIYSVDFLNWVGQNRVDFKSQLFVSGNEFTFNYRNSGNKLDGSALIQGHWRGIYDYFYDTSNPHTAPWEMLGFSIKPDWWESRYGPAPYTSDNLVLWNDLEKGFIWNNGDSKTVNSLARPGLSKIIPVDSAGKLRSPLETLVGNFDSKNFQSEWIVGDGAPVEYSYRRSSSFPFDLVKLLALTKPAQFFNLAVDLDNYGFNEEFGQYLVNDREYLDVSKIEVYGEGVPKTSYINWIVDYEKQVGISATSEIKELLQNLDVRLIYRLAGYSDKELLKFFVEKGTPNSQNASLLIPDENYSVLLYDNQPFDKLAFSSVIIQKVDRGFQVFGNAQNFAFFRTLRPAFDSDKQTISVENATVTVAKNYQQRESVVPYGTKFLSLQGVAQFLMSYGAYLEDKGMVFDQTINGVPINWKQMVAEFLYWAQTGWQDGSIITLNPAATVLKFNKDNAIVQPLTIQRDNFVLNQRLYPIQLKDLDVTRNGTLFEASALSQGDSIAYSQFNLGNIEHAVVFDNVTVFNDVIYNLVTGLRQTRINASGTKTAEWDGTVNASGFILNQDNIENWSRDKKYTRGNIVFHKNRFWFALERIQPANTFDESQWKQIDYDKIQKGLLPNAATRSFESTLYYDSNKANLEKDSDILGYSLIGYRPRDYLELADLTDVTQVNVYKNLIQTKGTSKAINAFQGANLPQGSINYKTYENWAIQSNEFGGVLNDNFVEFKLQKDKLTNNPSIVSLTKGKFTPGASQYVPLYSLYNFGRTIDTPDILSTLDVEKPDKLFPSAGFVSFDDVKKASYFFSGLDAAVNKDDVEVSLDDFYVRDYLWLANFKEQWNVFSWKPITQVTRVAATQNGNATITFENPHGLKKLDPVVIINFDERVNGYYLVNQVVNPKQIIVGLSLEDSDPIEGLGIGLSLISQRVKNPGDIVELDLLEAEFTRNRVWVDHNSDGNWAVYEKTNKYDLSRVITRDEGGKLGAAVGYSPRLGYLVSDPAQGKVFRYGVRRDELLLSEELTEGALFGTAIEVKKNFHVISEPGTSGDGTVRVYIINDTLLSDNLVLYQDIDAPANVTGEWGSSISLSGDTDWLYISAQDDSKVYVYRKQQIQLQAGFLEAGRTYQIVEAGDTDWESIGAIENANGIYFIATGIGSGTGIAKQVNYELVSEIDASGFLDPDDDFGGSIATDYAGENLLVGAPDKDFDVDITNRGKAYVYERTTQNILVNNPSAEGTIQRFPLAWEPATLNRDVSETNSSGNVITLSDATGILEDDPIIFTGAGLLDTGIEVNKVYYVNSISVNDITLKLSRSDNTPVEISTVPSITDASASIQKSATTVSVNGVNVKDNGFAFVGSRLFFVRSLKAGDLISVSGDQFVLRQEFDSEFSDRVNIRFGSSVDLNKMGSELLMGSPGEIDTQGDEGAVYRYTNGGAKYGLVIGTESCNVTTERNLLINGFLVRLIPGDAEVVADRINAIRIPNIQASFTEDNKLILQTIEADADQIFQKLRVSAFDSDTLNEIGITVYTQTQIIKAPHSGGPNKFGQTVKFNEFDSVAISAPTSARVTATTFDVIDDATLDTDTLFDNNATRFIDVFDDAGAVYLFDYLKNYKEGLHNPGKFVYAQSVNSNDLEYGNQPLYGSALAFNDNQVVVGAPDFIPAIGGQVTVFINETSTRNWEVSKQSVPVVDTDKIQNSLIFSASTNNTLINLDYIDPLQGKLLGAARKNIDFISGVDPAQYVKDVARIPSARTEDEDDELFNIRDESLEDLAPRAGLGWGEAQVGKIWFDTSNVRWFDYHQPDLQYNARFWGRVFPRSDVAVYTWVSSKVRPADYTGPGTPLDLQKYSIGKKLDAAGNAVSKYYFWVRNTNLVNRVNNKTLSDKTIESYIKNPKKSGISFLAALAPNTFALYNSFEFFINNDSVFHIGFSNGTTDDISHREYSLIREDFSGDFLPGVPRTEIQEPTDLYRKLLDSLSGTDTEGQIIPDPFLPKAVQSGIQIRPRQSFFFNRFEAAKNYFKYVNNVLKEYPIFELRTNLSMLFKTGEFFDTTDLWEFTNWWAPGFDDNTKSSIQVPTFTDLARLSVPINTIATVESNSEGKFEVYRYDGNPWTRVGLEDGTIEFKESIWDPTDENIGFGDNFFDTTSFDLFPSEEVRNILRSINEQIFTGDLETFRNKSLTLLFEYIQSESSVSENFLPWLNKTSLVDVEHTIRELKEIEVFKEDNQEFLEGYVEEVKPYHVVIKEFVFGYKGIDEFEGFVTDFDLPGFYDSQTDKFITPQLVLGTPTDRTQFSIDDPIWGNLEYQQWFENKGVSITGELDYEIATLNSFLSLASTFFVVNNVQGFPINGILQIGEEKIAYSFVDRANNLVGGLIRGVDNTPITDHIPGEAITIDLPPVVVLNGGKGYLNPPKVTAFIDESKFPPPSRPAVLEPVMSLDKVIQVRVIDPGEGYLVLPQIQIDSAFDLEFGSDDIDSLLHTIRVTTQQLATGDLVQYTDAPDGKGVGRLEDNQWYYVRVLETVPDTVVTLHTSFRDALLDRDRIDIFKQQPGTGYKLKVGAKASAISTATPLRENKLSLKFDRTTYTSQVQDWRAGRFYGAFFAGSLFNSERVTSSSISLQATTPPISDILASAGGTILEISDVRNDRKLEFSSFVRFVSEINSDNEIVLIPQDQNNPDLSDLQDNASGTTIGFYEGMPIKFVGAVAGGLEDSTVYFVKDIIDDIRFTVSDDPSGAVKTLTPASIFGENLRCFTGEVTDTAIMTVNYPGILEVTDTQKTTNAITVPLSPVGTGGTTGFYPGIPVFFTGNVFGGILENVNYFVTTVIDDETFTISETDDPVTTTATETFSADNTVKVDSTLGFSVNDPVIFNNMFDGSGIDSGTTYFVNAVVSDSALKLATVVNGGEITLTDATGTATVTNQKDTVELSTASGSMTINVSLPVSPGQINGQLFTLNNTSKQYPGIDSGVVSNLIDRTINATIDTVDKIALSNVSGGTNNFYVNLPLQVESNIGGLVTDTTYFVTEFSGEVFEPDPINEPGVTETRPNLQTTVTNTSVSVLTCDTTEELYEGMGIIFSGSGLGGIVIGQEYFVKDIINGTSFSISEVLDGPAKEWDTATGTMIGTGDPYIKVSESKGGAAVELSTVDNSPTTLTQEILAVPEFSISYILSGYRALITEPGEGFAIGNKIVISGNEVDGTSPKNDVILEVSEVGSDGDITSMIISGTVPDFDEKYYLRVISPNEVEVYENSLLTIPKSGIDFNFEGFTATDVTGVDSSDNSITVVDASVFEVNDAVVFTGDTVPTVTNITANKTYYILEKSSSTEIKISEIPGDSASIVNIVATESVDFKMTKAGSLAFLPEPFSFNQSIVRFNNRVYVCIISNNDDEFVFGKWQLLDSGDRRLNALDRAVGYYRPNDNMPGLDLPQLFDGLTYPNPVYLGNQFKPDRQFGIDTILQTQPFIPTGIDTRAVVRNGAGFVAVSNLPDITALLFSNDQVTWSIRKLSNSVINAKDIFTADGKYVIVADNVATSIFVSDDANKWSSAGIEGAKLNSVTNDQGLWVAVGDKIVVSPDTETWNSVKTFEDRLNIELFGVTFADIPTFSGFVAVGKGLRTDFSTGVTELIDTNIIEFSQNGLNWQSVESFTDKGLYGVDANGDAIVAVGDSGVIYYSDNGENWLGVNEVGVISVNSADDIINVTNTAGFSINDRVRITNAFGGLSTATDYFIIDIISSTQLQVSETEGGSPVDLTETTIPLQTFMFEFDPAPATLRDLVFADNTWIAVGDNGKIRTSSDYLNWTTQASGTTENLNSVYYDEDTSSFTVVGENSVILVSTDQGVSWVNSPVFEVLPDTYNLRGADFSFGYGPEELVPGVVTDSLAMTVTTRPGTNWPVTEYSHTGYNVVSVELEPTAESQVEYSFDELVQYPINLTVQVIDPATGLGTTIYDYDVNWINKTITLDDPLQFFPQKQKLRIDVYEVGNGDQLVKSSTDSDPIRKEPFTTFNEIYLSCNYSDTIFNGSGVIRPETTAIFVVATSTESGTNRIFCESVKEFTENEPITFQGITLGGIEESTTYFVKTISVATNSITISETFNTDTGTAGPTFLLSDDSGLMTVNINVGFGVVWTDPIVYKNGEKLVLGKTNSITRTKASNNAIVTNSTGGMIVGTPITFCNCLFTDSGIVPLKQYFIREIVNNTEFKISETPGGPVKQLNDATGGSKFITNDYSFAIQPDGIGAKIIFPTDQYSNDTDYIVYSVFGETAPEQFGYTVPEIQTFKADGSAAVFALTNAIDRDNPRNAVVEINGVRQTLGSYDICSCNDAITFTSPPPNNATVSVTTYNDTRRQYFNTQFGITGTPGTEFSTISVTQTNNTIGTFDQDTPVVQTFDQDDPVVVTYDENLNWITVDDTSQLVVNESISFSGTEFGGLEAGKTYYILEILSGTELVLSEEVGGSPIQLTNDSGFMTGTVNAIRVSPIVAVNNIITPLSAVTTATETDSGTNEITVDSVEGFVEGQVVTFRPEPVSPAALDVGEEYIIGFLGNTDWSAVGVTGIPKVGTRFEATSTGSGNGIAYPTESFDDAIKTDGTVYFVGTIDVSENKFTIVDQFGDTIELTGGTGSIAVEVGGVPSARITTEIDHEFETNTLIRIDGILGSEQLNGNIYHVRVIDDRTFEVYLEPYVAGLGYVNEPVTVVNSYAGEGFAWRSGTFYLSTTTSTNISDNRIFVQSTENLVEGTPVYFTKTGFFEGEEILGGLIQGQEYYIRNIDGDDESFEVSEIRSGDILTLADATGIMTVSQWRQVNVDRLWVTINGLRVPSSALRISGDGEVSILARILPGDEVIITSMINYASPDRLKYLNFVDKEGEAEVFRLPSRTRTWINKTVYPLSTEIEVQDVRRITNTITQLASAPGLTSGVFNIGILGDKNIISGIEVENLSKEVVIPSDKVSIIVEELAPRVIIEPGAFIDEGDQLKITILEGNTILVNGEQIRFSSVDFQTNTLSGIERGVNGTATLKEIPIYSEVFGLLTIDRLSSVLYNQSWNSNEFNEDIGDPLQISDTLPARFLNSTVS